MEPVSQTAGTGYKLFVPVYSLTAPRDETIKINQQIEKYEHENDVGFRSHFYEHTPDCIGSGHVHVGI